MQLVRVGELKVQLSDLLPSDIWMQLVRVSELKDKFATRTPVISEVQLVRVSELKALLPCWHPRTFLDAIRVNEWKNR